MSKEREVLKLARDVLLPYKSTGLRWYTDVDEALDAIEEVLAQPQEQRSCDKQEPVAWLWELTGEVTTDPDKADGMWLPLYTTPPQRKPLTDEELSHIYEEYHDCYGQPINANENWAYERAIEAAHGIKEKNT